ncbi:putative T6SS immunity periplasmic lipoprotein [Erwinia oleae]|uniref:putative T6SS immunity periplasmic lipoprotein n=1 Tax=Erwinia oleae TaxID=796334 RepID=UPI000551CB12|nr:putative T6SS immunity periplasmic lipoprotein [Erwinia oleae]
MKKSLFLFMVMMLLSGCGLQDYPVFRYQGEVFVPDDNLVCIKSASNDMLTFYTISSTEDDHKTDLAVGRDIKKQYPDTCIRLVLTPGVEYTMLYILNGVKYRVVFDSNGTINRSP